MKGIYTGTKSNLYTVTLQLAPLAPVSFKEAMEEYVGLISGKRVRTVAYRFNGTNLATKLLGHFGRGSVGDNVYIMYQGREYVVRVDERSTGVAFSITESY